MFCNKIFIKLSLRLVCVTRENKDFQLTLITFSKPLPNLKSFLLHEL